MDIVNLIMSRGAGSMGFSGLSIVHVVKEHIEIVKLMISKGAKFWYNLSCDRKS